MELGIMQGRLSAQIDNKIQAFPWPTWQAEFELSAIQNLSFIEWTLDHDRLNENPILTSSGRARSKN